MAKRNTKRAAKRAKRPQMIRVTTIVDFRRKDGGRRKRPEILVLDDPWGSF